MNYSTFHTAMQKRETARLVEFRVWVEENRAELSRLTYHVAYLGSRPLIEKVRWFQRNMGPQDNLRLFGTLKARLGQ